MLNYFRHFRGLNIYIKIYVYPVGVSLNGMSGCLTMHAYLFAYVFEQGDPLPKSLKAGCEASFACIYIRAWGLGGEMG